MLAESTLTRVAPVAGIAITHELMDGIELESIAAVDWRGTQESARPLVIRHEIGDVTTRRMTRILDVPPWCTFHMDQRGEPSSRFHAVFGEVDRLLSCESPGSQYVVRYAEPPHGPVIALQSELTLLDSRVSGCTGGSCEERQDIESDFADAQASLLQLQSDRATLGSCSTCGSLDAGLSQLGDLAGDIAGVIDIWEGEG